jgi:cobalt-zinc-cadmium efflux system outer membrane protein
MTKKLIIPLVLSLLAFTTSNGQAPLLPLDSLLATISRANPALLASAARAGAQNEYARGARNLDAPKISAGQYQTPYSLKPDAGSFMIQAEQMFTNPAKLKAKEKYMQGMSAVTEQEQAYLRNQLLAQARVYYSDQVVISKKLALLQNTRELLEYMLKDANIKLTYGKEKLNNIYKAKADLYELDNTSEELTSQLSQNVVMLNTLMNRDKQTPFTVDTTTVIRDYDTNPTDTSALAASRSDIKMIDNSIKLQQLNADVEYSKRKPDFGIQAGHMFSYGGYPNQYILMASVNIPIVPWASKEFKANLKGIHYELEELHQEKQDKINQAAGQLAVLKLEIGSKKRQLKNYRDNIIPAMQNSYKTALLAYEQNTGDLPSVLNGIKDLQSVRMVYLDRLQELLQLQVAYEKENEKY